LFVSNVTVGIENYQPFPILRLATIALPEDLVGRGGGRQNGKCFDISFMVT